MQVSDVEALLADIQAKAKDDDEAAHGMRDDLLVAVLEATAAECTNSPELAREALKSLDIEFGYWCG